MGVERKADLAVELNRGALRLLVSALMTRRYSRTAAGGYRGPSCAGRSLR